MEPKRSDSDEVLEKLGIDHTTTRYKLLDLIVAFFWELERLNHAPAAKTKRTNKPKKAGPDLTSL